MEGSSKRFSVKMMTDNIERPRRTVVEWFKDVYDNESLLLEKTLEEFLVKENALNFPTKKTRVFCKDHAEKYSDFKIKLLGKKGVNGRTVKQMVDVILKERVKVKNMDNVKKDYKWFSKQTANNLIVKNAVDEIRGFMDKYPLDKLGDDGK